MRIDQLFFCVNGAEIRVSTTDHFNMFCGIIGLIGTESSMKTLIDKQLCFSYRTCKNKVFLKCLGEFLCTLAIFCIFMQFQDWYVFLCVKITGKLALVAQLAAPSDWRPGGRGFNPCRGRQHSFVEIDHDVFSTVILSLPLIQEGQLSVSGKRMCTILVNRLED